MSKKVELTSTIKCPECGFDRKEIMQTDLCQSCDQCSICGKI